MRKGTMSFEKNSLLLLFFSIASSLCNYLFQVTTGNLLSEVDYGNANALLSLSVILSVPTALFTVLSSKYTTNYLTTEQPGFAAKWVLRLEKIALFCALGTVLAGALLSGPVASVLKFENRWFVFAAFALTAVNYLSCPVVGALQGSKRFLHYGVANLIASGVKFLGSILFLVIGLRLMGVIFALALGTILATVFAAVTLGKSFLALRSTDPLPQESGLKRYITGALLVQFCNAVLSNGDMLLVKAYATTAADAGVYSSAMVIGKIPLYVAGTLVAVLFPMVAEAVVRREATKKLFLKSMLYSGGIAVAFAVFLQLFGSFVFRLMFGERYATALPLLLPISIFIVFVTLITVEMNYFLAMGRNRMLVASLLAGFAAIYALVSVFHASITQMIYVISGVLAIVFVVNAVYGLLLKPQADAPNVALPGAE